MEGSLSHDFETKLAAADVWKVYGGLPGVLSRVGLVEGDGGVGTVLLVTLPPGQNLSVGTVLLVTLPPGTPGSETWKEKFIEIDNENYIKEALVIEGGFLNRGFRKYLMRIEIIGKDKGSIIKSTIEYEVDEAHASSAPVINTSGLAAVAEAMTKYIKEQTSEPLKEDSREISAA